MATGKELLEWLEGRATDERLKLALGEARRQHPDDDDAALEAFVENLATSEDLRRPFRHMVLHGGSLDIVMRMGFTLLRRVGLRAFAAGAKT